MAQCQKMEHIRGAPYHPMTHGKDRSLVNLAESFARWLITKFRDRGRVNTFWIGAKRVIP
jgi:hypothetical protein